MSRISGRGKGGRARAKALTKAERRAIARKAAAARMKKLTPEQRSQIARKAVAAREAKRKNVAAVSGRAAIKPNLSTGQ
jgi:hypothetical protein